MRLPSSPRKHYLTGIDWVLHAFCDMTERGTGVGNQSQIVLELGGEPEEDRLRGELAEFARRLPVAFGRAGRCWNLAPYWRYPPPDAPREIRLLSRSLGPQASAADVHAALERAVNTPLRGPSEHVVFHTVRGGGRNLLALVFDHRLLDARGAESFLALFERWCREHDETALSRAVPPPEPAGLHAWREKFRAGTRSTRFLRKASEARARYLPLPGDVQGRGFRFDLLPLTDAESRGVLESAFEGAGYLMLMPYVLARVCGAMHRAFEARGVAEPEYIVPVSVDMRPPEAAGARVFFNQMSFLLFRLTRDDMESPDRLFRVLRRQLYDQIKVNMPRDLCVSSMLIRIVPRRLMRRVLLLPLRGHMGSFCFAYVGDTAYPFKTFLDVPVTNLFHMPRVPLPPGLGFFFSNFHGRLNGVLSRLDGVLTPEEAGRIAGNVREGLLSGGSPR